MTNANLNGQPEPPKPVDWKYLVQVFIWLVTCVGMMVLAYRTGSPTTIPPPPVPGAFEAHNDFGWVNDPDAVQEVVRQITFKTFSDTPAGKQDVRDTPDSVYLWQAYLKTVRHLPAEKDQGRVGSCVSFGTNNAIERTMVCQISKGNPEQFKLVCEEVTYAGSRVQIGKGRIRGDGSVGAWAAQYVKDYGVVSREKHGSYDLSLYDAQRCKAWGQSGVPNELQTLCKEHPVASITQVKTWNEAKLAMAQGYGIAVCSDQGFSMKRDQNGVCQAQGSWGHCMCLDGYHKEGGREYGHIENSWGPNAHTGPVGWGGPSTAGFWADSAVIARMLGQNDSWAFSAVKGFPAEELDWFAGATSRRRFVRLSPREDLSCSDLYSPPLSLAP